MTSGLSDQKAHFIRCVNDLLMTMFTLGEFASGCGGIDVNTVIGRLPGILPLAGICSFGIGFIKEPLLPQPKKPWDFVCCFHNSQNKNLHLMSIIGHKVEKA